jgi:hypothetical protein
MNKSSAPFYTGILGTTICVACMISTLCNNAFNEHPLPQQLMQSRQEAIDAQSKLRSSSKESSEYQTLVRRMMSAQSNYHATINKPEIRSALERENELSTRLALTVGAQGTLSTIFLGMAYLNARKNQ